MKCHLLLFYTAMNHSSTGLWPVGKSGSYTTGNDQLSGWTKSSLWSFPKHAPQKTIVTVWCSTPNTIHHSFLNPGYTIPSKSRLSKSIKAPKTAMPATSSSQRSRFFSRTIPNCTSHNKALQKVERSSLQVFFPLPLPDLFPTDCTTSSILTTFSHGKMLPHNKQDSENAFQESLNLSTH